MINRPRRSVLYMPGSNTRALEKAKSLAADSLILDLEDAVAPSAKIDARNNIANVLAAGGYGRRELVVRINSLDSEWGEEDVAMVATSAADAICVPKVETAAQVHGILACLTKYNASNDLPIWVMCETPLGALNIQEIAAASDRIQVIVMGTSDLAKELRVPHTPQRLGFLSALGLCVLAARAYGQEILDGVYLDLNDSEGFVDSCKQGRELGFDGKTLIHPKQLAEANQVFGPSAEDIQHAKKLIIAFEEAEEAGQGVVLVDGKLVENLHVDEAKRILAIYKLIEQE